MDSNEAPAQPLLFWWCQHVVICRVTSLECSFKHRATTCFHPSLIDTRSSSHPTLPPVFCSLLLSSHAHLQFMVAVDGSEDSSRAFNKSIQVSTPTEDTLFLISVAEELAPMCLDDESIAGAASTSFSCACVRQAHVCYSLVTIV